MSKSVVHSEKPVVVINKTSPGCWCGCSWCWLFAIAIVFLVVTGTKVVAYLIK